MYVVGLGALSWVLEPCRGSWSSCNVLAGKRVVHLSRVCQSIPSKRMNGISPHQDSSARSCAHYSNPLPKTHIFFLYATVARKHSTVVDTDALGICSLNQVATRFRSILRSFSCSSRAVAMLVGSKTRAVCLRTDWYFCDTSA